MESGCGERSIIIWWDESEGDGVAGDNGDDFNHTTAEIVISTRAHKNMHGMPYASPVLFTHSSDLRTMQNIFHAGPYLQDAANVNNLSELVPARSRAERAGGLEGSRNRYDCLDPFRLLSQHDNVIQVSTEDRRVWHRPARRL